MKHSAENIIAIKSFIDSNSMFSFKFVLYNDWDLVYLINGRYEINISGLPVELDLALDKEKKYSVYRWAYRDYISGGFIEIKFEKVFHLMTPEQKKLFIYHLDLFRE